MNRRTWTQTREATKDLIEIRDHSIEVWGRDQAKTYLNRIRAAVDRICSEPIVRQRCGDELPGYFRLAIGSHIVFYREVGATVLVVRILHQRMDFESHLQ